MATLAEHAKEFDIVAIMTTAIVTALAFVVGLFWNDAIRSAIEFLLPAQDAVWGKFAAAIVVTVAVAVVIYSIYRTKRAVAHIKNHRFKRK